MLLAYCEPGQIYQSYPLRKTLDKGAGPLTWSILKVAPGLMPRAPTSATTSGLSADRRICPAPPHFPSSKMVQCRTLFGQQLLAQNHFVAPWPHPNYGDPGSHLLFNELNIPLGLFG